MLPPSAALGVADSETVVVSTVSVTAVVAAAGSITRLSKLPPLADTMWDLILDGSGGVIAAILGTLYIHRSRRSRQRTAQFAAHFTRSAAPR